MRYIICEDSRSGVYFWTLIKNNILKKYYQMVDISMMKALIPDKVKSDTLGITVVKDYLEELTNGKHEDLLKDNTFILCIDNTVDNIEVKDSLQSIYLITGAHKNIHVFNYICFEQLLFASGNELQFFPTLIKSKDYNVIKQHIGQFGLGHSRELKDMLDIQGISYKTTETLFNKLLERSVIYQRQKIGNKEYNRMMHHYIYKGKWSVCWTTDCTPNCPNDKCWEATGNNSLICDGCKSSLRRCSQSCIEVNSTVIRKYAEEVACNRKLPQKLVDRLKLLFDTPDIISIDNY